MNKYIFLFKNAIKGENGGPMVETVIAISAGLCILSGLLFFGGTLLNHIGQAKEHVSSLN